MSRLYVDIRNILNLDISIKSPVKAGAMGRYKSVFKGKGIEFDGFRAYSENDDDASLIDWKASIRANEMLIREFVEERNMNIFFLVDVGSTMKFGSGNKLKGEYAAEVALSLAHVILQSGDSVGFCLFADDAKCKYPFVNGPKQFYIFAESITNPRYYNGNFNFKKASDFLFSFARKSDIVFIISDFISMKGNWKDSIEMLAGKYDIIGIMVRDVRDSKMPSKGELVTMEDPYANRQVTVNSDAIKKDYEDFTRRQENNVEKAFLKAGRGFIKLYTNQSFIEPVTNFFNMRNRRWR
ncbi:DUF58 domain-containing protein [Candidatus Woesearchaeota archaeon]|nr:DUF58 domain-containing protein [Candidatus Woesearchaeota archaeon]